MMPGFALALIVLGTGLVLAVAAALRFGWFGPAQHVLEQKYAHPSSRFITVGGTRIHYLDFGNTGSPAVVMLSAQWADVSLWESWVAALSDTYRVIVVDLPGHGLTGPMVSGDYSFDAYLSLFKDLIREIDLEKFFLVGTSYSGIIAYRYAALHGDVLRGLILVCSSGAPRDRNSGRQPNEAPSQWFYRLIYPYYRPRAVIAWKLKNLLKSAEVTPAMIERFTDFNNRAGRIEEARKRVVAYRPEDPKNLLALIKVPTLIQWPSDSSYLSAAAADFFETWIGSSIKVKILYRGAGHLLPLDAPVATARDARTFLDRVAAGSRDMM